MLTRLVLLAPAITAVFAAMGKLGAPQSERLSREVHNQNTDAASQGAASVWIAIEAGES